MNNALKSVVSPMLVFIQRLGLWIQIRTLEVKISGRAELFVFSKDCITLANMDYAQIVAACELRRLKRKYRDLLPK